MSIKLQNKDNNNMKSNLWVHGCYLWVHGGYLSVLGGYLKYVQWVQNVSKICLKLVQPISKMCQKFVQLEARGPESP